MGELQMSKLLRRSLSYHDATALMHQAGIYKSLGDAALSLEPEEVAKLMPYLLRVVEVSDEEFRGLLSESSIGVAGSRYRPPQEVVITVPYASDHSLGNRIPVTELASASVIVWELAVRVAATLDAALEWSESLPPPEVLVSPGSSAYVFGGGSVVAAGIAFIVASYAGIPAIPPVPAFIGGAFVSTLGVIDKAVNWYKTIKEVKLVEAQTKLAEAQTKVAEAQARNEQWADKSAHHFPPASNSVPPENVIALSREFGLDPALGTHLLNQVLEAYLELIRAHKGVRASVSSSKTLSASTRARSAGAG